MGIYAVYIVHAMTIYRQEKGPHPKTICYVLTDSTRHAEHIAAAHNLCGTIIEIIALLTDDLQGQIPYAKVLQNGLLRTTKEGTWHTVPLPFNAPKTDKYGLSLLN